MIWWWARAFYNSTTEDDDSCDSSNHCNNLRFCFCSKSINSENVSSMTLLEIACSAFNFSINSLAFPSLFPGIYYIYFFILNFMLLSRKQPHVKWQHEYLLRRDKTGVLCPMSWPTWALVEQPSKKVMVIPLLLLSFEDNLMNSLPLHAGDAN